VARKKQLSDPEFVTAWAKAGTLDDVVEGTGMSRVGAQARASRLRKAGVLLRRFSGRGQTIDVKGLNDLLDKLGAKDDSPPRHGRRR
jgi:hypothetical protein